MSKASETAAITYNQRCREIRASMDNGSVAYADAMSVACAEYERAMVADIGQAKALRLGAGRRSIRR